MVAGPGRVRVGALALACERSAQRAEGERVRLGLRPEEVRIRGVEPAPPTRVPVTVELLDFLGAFCRATLRPSTARDLTLRSDFSANAMRDLGIREGQTLTVALPPETAARVRRRPAERGA